MANKRGPYKTTKQKLMQENEDLRQKAATEQSFSKHLLVQASKSLGQQERHLAGLTETLRASRQNEKKLKAALEEACTLIGVFTLEEWRRGH